MAPFLYVAYRVRGRRASDLAAFAALLALYVATYWRFVTGRESVFHDTLWDHQAFYAILKQWLESGFTVGWNPFMNGGEPLYLFSNLFLWAELIGIITINRLLHVPTHELINLYFTFVLMSFATLCFVFFSVVFRGRVIAFYAVIPVLFGGLTASTFAQYMLSPLYLLPAALLAAYLLIRDRDPVWLLALVFLVCVSANHYLPHYLVLSVAAYLAGAGAVAVVHRLWGGVRVGPAPVRARRSCAGAAGIVTALVLSAAALAPTLFIYREARDLVSPTRGNLAVAEGGIGVQPGVRQSWERYRYLVRLPRMNPADASWENLEYAHGVFYVGWLPVLLAVVSLAAYRDPRYLSFLLAFLLVSALALGDDFVVWRFLKAYVPLFHVRHAYPLALVVTLLLVVLSAFGLQRLMPWGSAQILICVLTLAASLQATSRVHGDPRHPKPFDLAPVAYPLARTAYSDPLSRVPVDSGPLITKRAAATHVNDDFVLFRSRPYHELVQRDLGFVTGPVVGWTPRLEWTAPDLSSVANEIENGSFERWRRRPGPDPDAGGVPEGFDLRFDGPAPRVEESRDPAWVLDGGASVRMVVPAGATAKLAYTHPRPASLRGSFLALSACLASRGGEPVVVTAMVLQEGGYNVLTPHTYRGNGRWECLQRTLLVADKVEGVELVLAVSSPIGAEVYIDRLDLRKVPEDSGARETPLPVKLLEGGNPNRLRLRVEVPGDGYLVRKENLHPGWSAVVDGRPIPIERYAGAFQAIALTRGPHTVEFTFQSMYPALMWSHVIAVLLGYVAFCGILLRALPSGRGPDSGHGDAR